LRQQLVSSLAELAGDDSVRVVVLTGQGDRAFCAGQDLAELGASGGRLTGPLLWEFETVCAALRDLPVPTIAVVNAAAIGGGLDLALSCDIVWAADTAILKTRGLAMGIVAGVPRLVGRVSRGQLAQLVYTGIGCDAVEAARLGLVDQVLPAEVILEQCLELARLIAEQPREVLMAAKRVLRADPTTGRDELIELQLQESVELLGRQNHAAVTPDRHGP